MCQFITAFLPGDADLTAAAARFDTHRLGFRRIDNPRVLAQAAPGEVFLLTTRGRCDCGTPLGSQARSRLTPQSETDDQIRRLRQRGWGQAKIRRWQEQKEMSEQKRRRTDENHAANATPQLAAWIMLISDLLRSGQAASLGLLLHEGHDIEGGRWEIERQEWVGLRDLTTEHLLHIQDDVLYRYRL